MSISSIRPCGRQIQVLVRNQLDASNKYGVRDVNNAPGVAEDSAQDDAGLQFSVSADRQNLLDRLNHRLGWEASCRTAGK